MLPQALDVRVEKSNSENEKYPRHKPVLLLQRLNQSNPEKNYKYSQICKLYIFHLFENFIC